MLRAVIKSQQAHAKGKDLEQQKYQELQKAMMDKALGFSVSLNPKTLNPKPFRGPSRARRLRTAIKDKDEGFRVSGSRVSRWPR